MISLMVKILILVCCCLSASAQGTVNRFPGQWVDDLFAVQNKLIMGSVYFIDGDNFIRKTIPPLSGIDEFPVPKEVRSGQASLGWYGDGLHVLAYPRGATLKDPDGTLFTSFTFAKWQDDEWHYLGSFNTPNARMHKTPNARMYARAIPCDNDRFIFVSYGVDVGNAGSEQTPFARMSVNRDSRKVSPVSSIDHGQDELRQHSLVFLGDVADSPIIMTDSYAMVLNYKTGLYWIFSLESASLRKAGSIFTKVTPEMIAKGGFMDAILCAHPEKDGTILISAQDEEAFTTQPDYAAEMKELWDNHRVGQPDATMTAIDWFELYQNREKQVKEQQPWIVWYRVHPESGKVEKILPPEGAAIERDGGENDLWRPMPDGSVQMGHLALKRPESEKAKAEAKKEEALNQVN